MRKNFVTIIFFIIHDAFGILQSDKKIFLKKVCKNILEINDPKKKEF